MFGEKSAKKLLVGLIHLLGSLINKIEGLMQSVNTLTQQNERIEQLMASTRVDLNAKIDAVATQIGGLGTDLQDLINRLKVPADFDAEVGKLQGIADGLTALQQTMQTTQP